MGVISPQTGDAIVTILIVLCVSGCMMLACLIPTIVKKWKEWEKRSEKKMRKS